VSLVLLVSAAISEGQNTNNIYICKNGMVTFLSEAKLELIKASSESLTGVLNLSDRSFSFTIPTKSFEGFNSSLQRTHFNEDYMETERYPSSTFKGKIIEEVNLSVPGEYLVRAKGKMKIHGIELDRIIRCQLNVTKDKILVRGTFTVFLADHNISIPTILNQKIATEIKIDVELSLVPSGN
jgi:polyisoprenoid-binding protein YceI